MLRLRVMRYAMTITGAQRRCYEAYARDVAASAVHLLARRYARFRHYSPRPLLFAYCRRAPFMLVVTLRYYADAAAAAATLNRNTLLFDESAAPLLLLLLYATPRLIGYALPP